MRITQLVTKKPCALRRYKISMDDQHEEKRKTFVFASEDGHRTHSKESEKCTLASSVQHAQENLMLRGLMLPEG